MKISESIKSFGTPQGVLAEEFLKSYLAGKGYSMEKIQELAPEAHKKLMTEACVHVSLKLAEIESRSRLRQKIELKF